MLRGMTEEKLAELRSNPEYMGMSDPQVEAKFRDLNSVSIEAMVDELYWRGFKVESR